MDQTALVPIGVEVARSRFKDLLDSACSGQSILITRNGRPVAKLGPLSPDEMAAHARPANLPTPGGEE